MKRKTIMGIVIGLVVIVASYIFADSYNENKNYESYLSDRLSNMVSPLSSSILRSEEVLSKALSTKTIEKAQLNQLRSYFYTIGTQTKSISEMGIRINKLSDGRYDNVSSVNIKVSDYFLRLSQTIPDGSTLTLSTEQLKEFHEINNLVEKYANIVRENVKGATPAGMTGEYWHVYFKKGIGNRFWINMMNAMDAGTPKYQTYSFLN